MLNAAGQATIWGTGAYRQVVYDQYGNLVWDRYITDTAFSAMQAVGEVSETVAELQDGIGATDGFFLQAGAGAVKRTQIDKQRERVTPEDYGAVGDGIHDDSAAWKILQDRINGWGGGGIELIGTYLVQAPANGAVAFFEELSRLQIWGKGKLITPPIPAVWKTGTSASVAGTLVTIFDSSHSLTVGSEIIVRGLSNPAADGYFVVSAVTPGVSFSYQSATSMIGITGTPQYTLADYGRAVIRYRNCNNVDIDVIIEGEERPVDQMYRLGYRGVYCSSGTNIENRVRVSGKGLSYAISSGGSLQRSSLAASGKNIGYGIAAFGVDGGLLTANVDTVHRGVYCANSSNIDIDATVANFDVSGIIVTRTEAGLSRNIRAMLKAAPQPDRPTGHRGTQGIGVYVNFSAALEGGYENLEIDTSLYSDNLTGIGRYPFEIDGTLVTGRINNLTIRSNFQRVFQTDRSLHTREFFFRAGPACRLGNISIDANCVDPAAVDSSIPNGVYIAVGPIDGEFAIARNGGTSGYFIAADDPSRIKWVAPYKPQPGGGVAFPSDANKMVVWPASRVSTGDFTVWVRAFDIRTKSGARTLAIAGRSNLGRSTAAMWCYFDASNNAIVEVLGADIDADYSGRIFYDVAKFWRGGYADVFVLRRGGIFELWIDGIKLNGTPISNGAAPGEGSAIDSDYCLFNAAGGQAFASSMGATAFFTKALSAGEMDTVSRGGTLADRSLVDHQCNYMASSAGVVYSQFSTRMGTLGSTVTPLAFGSSFAASAAIDPPSIAAGAVATVTASVPGAVVGRAVTASPRNALPAGIVQTSPGRVSAADTVSIDLLNVTAGAIDPPSNTWDITVER
ncbi:hypothetical protein [Pigmentiphaga daeguensis]|uniref:Pectate lyase superfamily protein n=1 Tax=Pigmentiphaga daeguensis TaxID=414049 RepID=A0ABN1D2F1_9BURK